MFIKRKGCQTINTDHIQRLYSSVRKNDSSFILTFCMIRDSLEYHFETEEELTNYYNNLLNTLNAVEISSEESLTIT